MGRPALAERPLLLGSASPRRRELLASAGVPILVVAPRVDETLRSGEKPADYLARVTAAKLRAARATAEDTYLAPFGAVLVADTIVELGGEILDKPESADAARAALQKLSGQTHRVSTRFVLGSASAPSGEDGSLHAETVTTEVTMRVLSPTEIERYVAAGEGLDKAGGYGIQGGAAGFVARIDGSYTNVVGLPLAEVVSALRDAGLWE